jgi:hypothetical protein
VRNRRGASDEASAYEQWKVRAPTRDELDRLWHKLAAARDRLTPDLWRELNQLLLWEMAKPEGPWTREMKMAARWAAVCEGIKPGVKREEAYDFAVTRLADTPARCRRDMAKKDFDAMQRKIRRQVG